MNFIKKKAINIIGRSHIGLNAKQEALIKDDIIKLLGEYFVIKNAVSVEILDEKHKLKIKIEADIKDIKRFKILN